MAEGTGTDATAGGALVGRDRELRMLLDAGVAAAGGHGSTVVIRGAAGLGKTALLAALADEAGERGMRVCHGRGDPLEQEFPWNTATQLLSSATDDPRNPPGDEPIPDAPDGASLMAALHRLYLRTLQLSQDAPVALLIDDAHWCDAPSLRWLAYMANRVAHEPILLAVASRPGGTGAVDVWSSVLSAAAVLDLAPLGTRDAARVLGHALGRTPEAGFADRCYQQSGGNPFLLGELAASLRSAGVPPIDDFAGEVDAAGQMTAPTVSLRLRRLGEDARAVANAQAVLGTEATVARVAQLAQLPSPRAKAGLRRLVDDGLVVDGALTFVHPLLRTAAYEDLPPLDRGDWHLRAARLLADAGCGADVWVAHLLRATPAGDPWVVARLRQAASAAEARAAPELARRYLERALAEPPSQDAMARVLLDLGRVELTIDPPAAADRFRTALERVADAAEDREARIGLANALSFAGRFRDAADILEDGLNATPETLVAERDALLAALLNTARWDSETRSRCLPHLETLKDRARAGDPLPAVLAGNLALELLAEGRDREWMIREATAATEALESAGLEGAMWLPLIRTPLACAGLLERSLQLNERHLERIRRHGWTTALAIALAGNAKIRIWRGDIAAAHVDAEEAVAMAEDPISTAYAVMFLVEALRLRDEPAAAWELLERHGFAGPLSPVWPFPQMQAERGWLRYERGDLRGALADLSTFGDWAERVGLRCPAVVPWRSRAAVVAAALHERDRAERLAASELEDAGLWGDPRSIGVALRGLAAVREDERLDTLREAVATLAGSEARLEHAEALLDLGSELRRRGHRREARDPLRQALHIADQAGALAVARRAHQELIVAGARPRRPAMRGQDALTASELRVARLAGQGRSNPEIANLLFITRRTVETHLTQAYRKLGIHAREQLAEALSEPVPQ